jgi:hypothetical protein
VGTNPVVTRNPERNRLAANICAMVYTLNPDVDIERFFAFRQRVYNSSLDTLRKILELDMVRKTARRVERRRAIIGGRA